MFGTSRASPAGRVDLVDQRRACFLRIDAMLSRVPLLVLPVHVDGDTAKLGNAGHHRKLPMGSNTHRSRWCWDSDANAPALLGLILGSGRSSLGVGTLDVATVSVGPWRRGA